jgi:predicted alpha/beta-hydrolase family hydrolase
MPPHLYLGHGASGTAASMLPFVTGLERRGIAASAVDMPKRRAEDAVPAWRAAVPDADPAAPRGRSASPAASTSGIAVGGHSYGGRVASLAAAEPDTGYVALVLFSYPLHPPGAPERGPARVAHWPRIRCPVLLLSGESDPFARIELLRASLPLLADARLVTYPHLGHTLGPVLDDVLDRVATFLRDAAG